MTWRTRIEDIVAPSLIDRVPRDHEETDRQFLRRRIVVAVALVAGAVLLGLSLSIRPGDSTFYALTAAVAVVWTVGGLASAALAGRRLPLTGLAHVRSTSRALPRFPREPHGDVTVRRLRVSSS